MSLEWNDPHTKRRCTKSSGTDDLDEAETARAALETQLNSIGAGPRSVSWDHFRDRYRAEHLSSLRARSIEKSEMVLDLFEVFAKPVLLASIDESKLSQFAADLRRQDYAAWTIRNYLGALRAAFRWADGQRMMTAPRVPTVRVPKLKPVAVDPTAVEKLLAAANSTWRALLLCGWFAGLRLSEAYQLRRSVSTKRPYVDLVDKTIVLPARFVKANEDQAVPIHGELASALHGLSIDPNHPDRYFYFSAKAGDHAGEEITRSGLSHAVGLIAKRAGVKVTMHDLRRGFGSRLAKTVPPAVLQAAMRHANISTTMQFYVNVQADVRSAIESLSRGAKPKATTKAKRRKST